jgi:hypothetical protein
VLKLSIVVVLAVSAVCCDSAGTGTATVATLSQPEPHTDQGAWVKSVAGPPDEDYASDYEVPRPPIVARMITYNAKHVRVILMPEVPGKPNAMDTAPPYKWWTIVAFSDPDVNANAPLSRAEGMRRLRGR